MVKHYKPIIGPDWTNLLSYETEWTSLTHHLV